MWYSRDAALDGVGWQVSAWESEDHPDGAIVEAAGDDVDGALIWRSRASDAGILSIALGPDAVPGAPDLWFVKVDEPRATPPACNVVAFASDDFPPGTVITNYRFATAQVANDKQVGALRWYPRDGLVHQVYVAPDWRRRRVGSAVIYAASAIHQSHGWPGKLHSDGRRTDLGDMFVAALRHPERIAPLTETMPPMDAGA